MSNPKPQLIESQKTRLELRTSADGVVPEVFAHVVELTDVPVPSLSRSVADVTTLDDDYKRKASTGVIDTGSIDIKGLALSGDVHRGAIKAALISGAMLDFKVVLVDGSYHRFCALVTKYGREVKIGDKIKLSFTLDIDGKVEETDPV